MKKLFHQRRRFSLGIVAMMILYVWSENIWSLDLKALQDSLHKLGDPWVAGTTSVSHLSWEEKQELWGGTIFPSAEEIANDPVLKAHDMTGKVPKKNPPPASWDWRDVNGHDWMTQPKDQQGCRACWAFAMIGMFEARYKIVNNIPDDRYNPDLSEQFLISCDPLNYGCNGGRADWASEFLIETSVPDESCFPYQASNLPCSRRCSDWESRVVSNPIDWGLTQDVSEYKNLLMEAPLYIGVTAKEDFFYYQGGAYEPVMGRDMKSNHGVVLCGWNAQGNWLIRNSWGTGENQFMWTSQVPDVPVWLVVEANEMIKLDKREFVEPNDNVWDPGETIDIITTLKTKGIDYTGVTGKLSTTDSDVTISNDTYNFGSIPEGSSANNSASSYKATAKSSANEHDVVFNLHITADGGYSRDVSFIVQIGIARFDYVDVPAGNAILTVTDIASIGYDKLEGNGNGFIYPAGGSNILCHATMSFGNSSSYLVDNWHIRDGSDQDWSTVTSPDGRIQWVSPPTMGDTMNIGYYDDSGISPAKNVVCKQEAWAFKGLDYDDFVIIRFQYTNNGSSTLTGLYSAIFADFDIGDAHSNNGGINESKYLGWVSGGSIYGGITLLDPLDKLANASTIKNKDYVGESMTDANQYEFMNHTLHFMSQLNNDYSAMVSAGPFDLAPGGSQTVVFAIVGGKSKTEIEAHSDAARNITGVEETEVTQGDITFDVLPNFMLNTGTITFSLPKVSNVTIDVYDITGRHCQNLVQGQFKAETHTLKWNIKDEPTGVFFVKLKVCNCKGKPICLPLVKKVILLK